MVIKYLMEKASENKISFSKAPPIIKSYPPKNSKY